MVKKSKGLTEGEGSGGGLLPAVEGHSLVTRYKQLPKAVEFVKL